MHQQRQEVRAQGYIRLHLRPVRLTHECAMEEEPGGLWIMRPILLFHTVRRTERTIE